MVVTRSELMWCLWYVIAIPMTQEMRIYVLTHSASFWGASRLQLCVGRFVSDSSNTPLFVVRTGVSAESKRAVDQYSIAVLPSVQNSQPTCD